MKVNKYIITMQDNFKIETCATSKKQAINIICNWFLCSKNAIKNIIER
jgi:hypothetical protein